VTKLWVNNCTGWCLFRFWRLRIEFWRVPQWEQIQPHVHNQIVSRFIFFDKHLRIFRAKSCRDRAIPLLRWYTVPAGVMHCAVADRGVGRFINIEWWTGEWPSQSAAEDFQSV